jgi:hypothetical protein
MTVKSTMVGDPPSSARSEVHCLRLEQIPEAVAGAVFSFKSCLQATSVSWEARMRTTSKGLGIT